MNRDSISTYLQTFKGNKLDVNILNTLLSLKERAVEDSNQLEAKNLWCLEQVYKVISHYLNAFNLLVNKEFFKAWCELERVDIELSFLRRHLKYCNDDKYNLLFIEKRIKDLEKMFPYEYFASRESIVKSWSCSICKQPITIRNTCEHLTGEIYNGELCLRVAGDIEFKGVSIVKNPFDKYTVLFPENMEYDYGALIELIKYWKHPYEKWTLNCSKIKKQEYKNVRRNAPCPCGSKIKYKKCCLDSKKESYSHIHVLFENRDPEDFKNQQTKTFGTWKT